MSARFVYRPLSAENMTAIGNGAISGVRARIAKALNVQDSPAKPLSTNGKGRKRYFYVKKAKGLNPARDLVFSGRTMASIKVISATANQVRIGFDNPQAARIAAINQNREAVFWFSPSNQEQIRELISQAIRAAELVRVGKVA
jgi:hypothetical protein